MNKKHVLVTVCIFILVFQACSNPSPAPVIEPTKTATLATSTSTPSPTITPTSTSTPIPLAWKQISDGESFERDTINAFIIDPKNQNVFYAGMKNAGIYKSMDGGMSWEPVEMESLSLEISSEIRRLTKEETLTEEAPVENIGPDGKKRLYRLAYGEVSEDNGDTWHTFTNMGFLAAAFDSSGNIYLHLDNHLHKFSMDGKPLATLGNPRVGPVVTHLAISPNNPDIIYAAGKGLSVSKDGGMTWTQINNGLGNEVLQLDAGSGNASVLYLQAGECGEAHDPEHRAFQDDAGQPLYVSRDGGQNWVQSIRTGCHLIKDADQLILYRVGQQWIWSADWTHYLSWLWWSKDQGNTWQTKYVTDVVPPFTAVAHLFQSGILSAYSPVTFRHPGYGGAKTYKSEAYGSNWKMADATGIDLKLCYGSTMQFIDAYRPMAIDPQDGNHVFVIDNGVLLESHDSCDSTGVFSTAPSTNMNSIAFDPNNSNIVYAGTDGGAYVTFDGGETWGQINDGLVGSDIVYSIAADSESNVYAATPYGVFKLER